MTHSHSFPHSDEAEYDAALAESYASSMEWPTETPERFCMQNRIMELDRDLRGVAGKYSGNGYGQDELYAHMTAYLLEHAGQLIAEKNAYIVNAAKWNVLNWMRHENLMQTFSDTERDESENDESLLSQIADDGPSVEAQAEQDELRALLLKVVAELPEENRQIVIALGSGMTKTEIARKMGVTQGRISQRLTEIRAALGNQFAEYLH